MPRKQPLGLAKGEKERERKKWCSVMTRWTPGARRDTPGFIGLGTLQGPCYTACVHLSNTAYINYTHTHTHDSTLRSHSGFLSSGEPTPHSYRCCYGNRKTNTGGARDVDPLHSGKVCYPAFLPPLFICPSVEQGDICSWHS